VRGVPTGGGFVVDPVRGAPISAPVGPVRAPDDGDDGDDGIGALTAPVPIGAVFGADADTPGTPVDDASLGRAPATVNRVDDASLPSVDGRAETPNSDGAPPGASGMYAAAAGCVSVEIADAATSVATPSENGFDAVIGCVVGEGGAGACG
jgi:hypothetical protein